MPPAAAEPPPSAPAAASSSSREQDGAAGTGAAGGGGGSATTAASVTPLRKQALLLEARRSRVEWVDAASSPHRRIGGVGGDRGGVGGGGTIEDILGRPATVGGGGDGTGTPSTSPDDVGGGGNDGMALLRSGARACASLKSAVPVLSALYDGIPPRQIEERIARQLVSQVSSEDVREILASQSAAAMPPSSAAAATLGGGAGEDVPPAARKAAAGYEVFIQRLRSPEAAELVQGMKHFVASLEDSVSTSRRNMESSDDGAGDGNDTRDGSKGNIASSERVGRAADDNDDEDHVDPREAANVALADTVAKSLHSYLDKTLDTLRTHVLWEKDAEDEFELRASLALETFLFQKCRRFLFDLTTDPKGDVDVSDKIDSLQFVTWRHLDIHCLEGLDEEVGGEEAKAAGEEASQTETKDDGEAEEGADDDSSKDEDRNHPDDEGSDDAAATASGGGPPSASGMPVPPRVPKTLWSAPVNALRAVDAQWSPTSQLVLIVEAYRGVSAALTAAAPGDRPPGADDTLPALILALLHARPHAVLSNLNFVQHFARAEMLRGEPGYVLTSLWGAVQFLRDVRDASSLTISPDEFAAGLDRCRRDVGERRGALEDADLRRRGGGDDDEGGDERGEAGDGAGGKTSRGDGSDAANVDDGAARWVEDSTTTDIPPGAVRAARLRGEDVDMEWARRYQRERQSRGGVGDQDVVPAPATMGEVPSSAGPTDAAGFSSLPEGFDRTYTFLGTQPEDVRVSDVPRLLDEYHMLVRACEAMLVERSADRAAEQKRRLRRVRDRLESDAAAAAVSVPWSGSGGGGTSTGGGSCSGSSRGGGDGGTGGGGI